ncbi:MAG: hypothetical protein MJ201_01800 [Mycoplasmoidaceae bacterium]|nr:hypothetical protein [Mycoplasmoidaceae bacterium]
MFKQYFEYNAAEHPKLYNIHHKVDITRDLLIEFCNLTSQKLPSITFDLPKDTYQDLVIYS